jgi:hypothetical protein
MSEEVEPAEGEKLSMLDITRSLNGYEENEIEERFGYPIGVLMNVSLTKAGRAFIFITESRKLGGKFDKAYHRAMSLTIRDVNDAFLDEDEDEDDVNPDEPHTDQGKDGSPSD